MIYEDFFVYVVLEYIWSGGVVRVICMILRN